MRYKKLGSTGLSVSVIGFGASPLGDVFQVIDEAEAERAVHAAIDAGINLFDVSPYYGATLAEDRLGKALAGRRDKVILATKCGRYGKNDFDFSAKRVKRSLDESLARLRTDHVDLLQAHDIEFGDIEQILEETLPALREIQRQGKVRYIGVTGYPPAMLATIARQTPVDVVLSYCRYNLMITDMNRLLTPLLQSKSIGLLNASPLHMGLLTDDGPPPWHPAPQSVKDAGARLVRFCRERGICVPVAALRFCLDHPYVASTLIGMVSQKHVQDNLRALDAKVDPTLLAEIQQIVDPVRDCVWSSGRPANSDNAVPAQNASS